MGRKKYVKNVCKIPSTYIHIYIPTHARTLVHSYSLLLLRALDSRQQYTSIGLYYILLQKHLLGRQGVLKRGATTGPQEPGGGGEKKIAHSQILVNIRIQTFSFKMPWITTRSQNFQTLLRACTMGKKKEELQGTDRSVLLTKGHSGQ